METFPLKTRAVFLQGSQTARIEHLHFHLRHMPDNPLLHRTKSEAETRNFGLRYEIMSGTSVGSRLFQKVQHFPNPCVSLAWVFGAPSTTGKELVPAMCFPCRCPSLPFSATKNCESQARHAVFSKGTSHLLCFLISGSSCWKSRRQRTIILAISVYNTLRQHKHNHCVFSFPFSLRPQLSPSLLWKANRI